MINTFIFYKGLIPFNGQTLSNQFKWFIPVKIGPMMQFKNLESTILSFRFILFGWEAIVYNQTHVVVVNSKKKSRFVAYNISKLYNTFNNFQRCPSPEWHYLSKKASNLRGTAMTKFSAALCVSELLFSSREI